MARQNNADYWAQRIKNMEDALLDQSYAYVDNLEAQFSAAEVEIERQLSVWYQRFADNNEISLADAKCLLNTRELEEFRWTVGEYISYGEQNALDGKWMKQLENASARVHISRLESLKLQLQQQAEILYANQMDAMDQAARRMYEGSYYHTAFEVQRGLGVGWTMHALSENAIAKALSRPWTTDNQTFRDRCWTNKQSLVNAVNTQLTQMIILGESPDRAIAAIAKQFNVSRGKAGRLVMTESAYFASAAQKDCYAALDVERYEIIASFDHETCGLCAALDGKVFKQYEYQVGLTAPPFHPWCRCCTCPYFEDMAGLGERWTRNEDGTTKKVPRDMTFEDWKKSFVEPKAKAKAAKPPGPSDVLDEYIKTATPGQGSITYDEGYNTGKHKDEIRIAEWLHSTFGGDIRLLKEAGKKGVKMPDYNWRGKLWELKGTTSINGADKLLQTAIKQIKNNPGGVILEILADVDMDALERQLAKRVDRSKIAQFDMLILKNKKLLRALRYKK